MRDLLVYVAGPITKGGVCLNIGRACATGIALIKAGIGAYVPHLTCYMGYGSEDVDSVPVAELCPGDIPIETWYELSLIHVRRCDALIRLPGESRGADLGEAEMRKLGRPVFHTLDEVVAWANESRARIPVKNRNLDTVGYAVETRPGEFEATLNSPEGMFTTDIPFPDGGIPAGYYSVTKEVAKCSMCEGAGHLPVGAARGESGAFPCPLCHGVGEVIGPTIEGE